ncbi:hypothetical protein SO802_018236 [Lithocarpus litseifolius]|uniref:Uncharacterized protein n=1 Tax=Lithocarpus litseifolius TaxID=425828 RepID=A0AAW2CKS3_9ROSI
MSLLSVHDDQRVDNPKDLGVGPSGGESCLDLLKTLECDKNLELAFAVNDSYVWWLNCNARLFELNGVEEYLDQRPRVT